MPKKLTYVLFAIACIVATLAASSTAQAQTTYSVCNSTAVNVNVCVQVDCGGVPITLPCSVILGGPPYNCTIWNIPAGCTVSGVFLNGRLYPMGYVGPTLPPNPPNSISVSASGANIL